MAQGQQNFSFNTGTPTGGITGGFTGNNGAAPTQPTAPVFDPGVRIVAQPNNCAQQVINSFNVIATDINKVYGNSIPQDVADWYNGERASAIANCSAYNIFSEMPCVDNKPCCSNGTTKYRCDDSLCDAYNSPANTKDGFSCTKPAKGNVSPGGTINGYTLTNPNTTSYTQSATVPNKAMPTWVVPVVVTVAVVGLIAWATTAH